MPDRTQALHTRLTAVLNSLPDPSGGTATLDLEQALGDRLGISEVVAMASGTMALQGALAACGIGPGDEVLVPALTVVMTVAPVIALGARPVFVDSDPVTLEVNYADAEAKCTVRTRAIVAVHLWGRMGDPAALETFATEHGLTVVEDAAQAIGTARNRQRAGTVGSAGCFSMKDGKILASAEGGFVVTDEPEIAARVRAWRNHGQPPPRGEILRAGVATNARLATPLAAIAHTNLDHLHSLVELRRAQAGHVTDALTGVPGLRPLSPALGEDWNGYAPLLHLDLPRPRAFAQHLARLGVPSSTGTFNLVPCDTRPGFTYPGREPCRGAAQILDHTLAVILTEHDTTATLDRYADVIAHQADVWAAADERNPR
ncbi:DegT/DnrJ/EryC1/StrS family aminotransferase [Microlunatus speluncae]|uniref:DegT/DnrJ/EryC1/StrS family aminotransferase n=1 Tax=Microlunatus speluncae TaxID=2594267 RepID=UPI001C2D2031|nr:DegT/DnrJ/EryC1/StrS family aminotransferase [Microlunatus speluncae]